MTGIEPLMNRVLIAHGSRKSSGVTGIRALADRVATTLGAPVQVAFADVLGPTPARLLGADRDRPAVLVPAFLSRGYHVHTDLPRQILASGHPDVTVSPALGPSPGLVRMLADQLAESSWRTGDPVILAAAGSSNPLARADLAKTAAGFAARIGAPVQAAFAATGYPRVDQAVTRERSRSDRPVTVVSYLLADGVFQDRLVDSGADTVTPPLGEQTAMVELIADLFRRATPEAVAGAAA